MSVSGVNEKNKLLLSFNLSVEKKVKITTEFLSVSDVKKIKYFFMDIKNPNHLLFMQETINATKSLRGS